MKTTVKALALFCKLAVLTGCAEKRVEPIQSRTPGARLAPPSTAGAAGGSFARGDGEERVKAAMGSPDGRLTMPNNDEVWNYKFSSVTFRGGRVRAWNDPSKVLRTRGPGETGEYLANNDEDDIREGQTLHIPNGLTLNLASGTGNVPTAPTDSRYINPERQVVGGYQRADGSQVPTYERTRANATRSDNLKRR
jgi:hypothetical protein